MKDARLDRLVQFDERSRNFPIRAVVPKKPRSYTWRCTTTLDQGNIGQCVGFGVSHELLARPAEVSSQIVNYAYAHQIYLEAQKIDEWPGEDYEGTSVLAGVKVAKSLGWMKSYRWGFSLDDLILGVGYNGPAVLGISWLEGMMDINQDGFIIADGDDMGGHCILCRGVNVNAEYFLLHNSWGASWGINGDCKITFKDMERLLKMEGEQCFFVDRVTHL